MADKDAIVAHHQLDNNQDWVIAQEEEAHHQLDNNQDLVIAQEEEDHHCHNPCWIRLQQVT